MMGRRCARARAVVIVYAGDMFVGEEAEPSDAGVTPADGLRVAEDDEGLVGVYSLLVRSGATGVEVELTGMLVASRARVWAVDRLLVQDMRRQATLRDAHEITVLTRPPLDALFRHLGGRAVGLQPPWGAVTRPLARWRSGNEAQNGGRQLKAISLN